MSQQFLCCFCATLQTGTYGRMLGNRSSAYFLKHLNVTVNFVYFFCNKSLPMLNAAAEAISTEEITVDANSV